MESVQPGALVKVSGDGPERDGIVFDTPSTSKVVVAVVDARRGPRFCTVHPRVLSERTESGSDDPALRRLLRRTPLPVRGAARAAKGAGHEQAAHTRAAGHRTTGK